MDVDGWVGGPDNKGPRLGSQEKSPVFKKKALSGHYTKEDYLNDLKNKGGKKVSLKTSSIFILVFEIVFSCLCLLLAFWGLLGAIVSINPLIRGICTPICSVVFGSVMYLCFTLRKSTRDLKERLESILEEQRNV